MQIKSAVPAKSVNRSTRTHRRGAAFLREEAEKEVKRDESKWTIISDFSCQLSVCFENKIFTRKVIKRSNEGGF